LFIAWKIYNIKFLKPPVNKLMACGEAFQKCADDQHKSPKTIGAKQSSCVFVILHVSDSYSMNVRV